MNQEARVDYLITYLAKENPQAYEQLKRKPINKFELFRGLVNVRKAEPVTDEFIRIQNAYLTEINYDKPLTSIHDLQAFKKQLYLWQGDITTLDVDAIVNAANSELLGCTQANHNCIDNIIHTHAGVQLRLACNDIMQAQGRKEPVGKAKITQGYNLPAKYVIHTVGPYIDERGPSRMKEELLASSYKNSLALADEYKLESIAFCSISTGEFNFPNQRAAEIAIVTVTDYINQTQSELNVIFNVFKQEDLDIYQSLLSNE